MKATIDTDTCIGCGMCEQIEPRVFQLKGEKAQVIAHPIPSEAEESAKEAAEQCPVQAIHVTS